ncbi:MAG TPA: hypothetical protein VFO84_00670 [Dehalococcoidia bacterium]|nr:hypothetical protein [Dehalococcoidia bacterium]
MTDDLIEVTLAVAAIFDRCGIGYTVGGSLASSLSGEPRASLDADVVVRIRPDQIHGLVILLGDEFYADPDAIRRAIDTGRSTNLVHRPSGIKVDLFPAASFLDHQQLLRRQLVKVASDPTVPSTCIPLKTSSCRSCTGGRSWSLVERISERGARVARREERAYREYLSDEQRRQAGCPARKALCQ